MIGIRKPSTELDTLAAGLGQIEDPYFLKPLEKETTQGLAEAVKREIRYSAVSMIRAGRYFMAIKKRLGHGEWEKFVIAERWSWAYVRASMKLLEVAAHFPQALHLADGRMVQRVLYLPAPEIESFLGDLSPDAVKKLTPWDIERIYDAKRDELRKTHRKKKPIDPAILAQIEQDLKDAEWKVFIDAYDAATRAINELAAVKVKPEWYDRIFDRLLLKKLGRVYEKVSKSLHPVEEVLKRREIVHVRGFAKQARGERR